MDKNYNQMSNSELKKEQETLQEQFTQYHSILKEVYECMYDLSVKNNEINEILNKRNGN